jgi:hypothetical protein
MTKCGHVFCYHCIIQYHTLEPYDAKMGIVDPTVPKIKQRWRKCPMCYEATYETDLKYVRFWSVNPPLRGLPHNGIGKGDNDIFKLRKNAMSEEDLLLQDQEYARVTNLRPIGELNWTLVARHADSVLVSPATTGYQQHPPMYSESFALVFSKFILSSKDYLINEVLLSDIQELEHDMTNTKILSMASSQAAEASRQELMFYNLACEKLRTELTRLKQETRQSLAKLDPHGKNGKVDSGIHISPNGENGEELPLVQCPENTYFFYQSADGQHYYIHPLDIRILKQEFGDYDHFPSEISPPVLNIQETTMTADLRKRFRYLGHLPLGCDLAFVELDLSSIVSQETWEMFHKEIEIRGNERKKRAREEALQVLRMMQSQVRESQHSFDSLSDSFSSQNLGSSSSISVHENDLQWVIENTSQMSAPLSTSPSGSLQNGVSFAQVTASSHSWAGQQSSFRNSATSSARPDDYSSYEIDLAFEELMAEDELVGNDEFSKRGGKKGKKSKVKPKTISLNSGHRRY